MRPSHFSFIAVVLTLLTLGTSVVSAEGLQPITIQDLQGSNWTGERQEVSIDLFWEEDSPHLRQRSPDGTVVADVDPVNNNQLGSIDFLLRYKTADDHFSKVHTAVIGKVERNKAGLPILTLHPAAKKFEFVPMSWVIMKDTEAK